MEILKTPTFKDWQFAAVCLVGYCVFAVPVGLLTGLFQYEPSSNLAGLLRTALIAIVLPSFLEELIFRGPLIIMRKQQSKMLIFASIISLVLFVAWHPINALTLMPQAASIFFDLRFLSLAAALGATATIIALKTRSIWPAIAFHWCVVVGWKGMLGAPAFL